MDECIPEASLRSELLDEEPEKSGATKNLDKQPPLSTVKLLFISFFLTCGGPFGIEDTVRAAGPGITLLGLLVLPLIYALPQALMIAEMSTMIYENGGYVIWVQRAFGEFVGWINAFSSVAVNSLDNALYPVLIVDYLSTLVDLSTPLVWLVKLSTVIFVAAANIFSLTIVAWLSGALSIVILSPFLIFFLIRLPDIRPASQWLGVPSVNWGLYFSTALWMYGGWTDVGTLAGEVRTPGTTFPRVVMTTLSLNTVAFLVPVVAALTVSSRPATWQPGFFGEAAEYASRKVDGGTWLGVWVVVGSVVSSYGIYNAAMATTGRALWAMGRPAIGHLPACVAATWQRRGSPVVAILINSVLTCILMSFDFSLLIQCEGFLSNIHLVLVSASFLYFKYKEPNAPRPYVVPGGKLGAWLLAGTKIAVSVAALALSNLPAIVVGSAVLAVVITAFFVRLAVRKLLARRAEKQNYRLLGKLEYHEHSAYMMTCRHVDELTVPIGGISLSALHKNTRAMNHENTRGAFGEPNLQRLRLYPSNLIGVMPAQGMCSRVLVWGGFVNVETVRSTTVFPVLLSGFGIVL